MGAAVILPFEGTAAYICITSNSASYDIALDGFNLDVSTVAQPAAGTRCGKTGADTILTADGLDFGTHNVTLTLTSAPSQGYDFRFYGGGIVLGVNTGGTAVNDQAIIDDRDTDWVFLPGRLPVQGGWDIHGGTNFYNNSETYICVYSSESTAMYNFTGAGGVVLNGTIDVHAHALSIELDGEVYALDATSSWSDGSTVFFAKGNLDPSVDHTLVITNYNPNRADCTTISDLGQAIQRTCCTRIDALTLLKATLVNSTPHAGSPLEPAVNGNPTPAKAKPQIGAIVGGGRWRHTVHPSAVAFDLYPRTTWNGDDKRQKTLRSGPDKAPFAGMVTDQPPPQTPGEPRLTHEDLERVAAYVASRLAASQLPSSQREETSISTRTAPPGYTG
ncbi:hypothetical protein EXIGLDRAFT_776788 [Exidia glandulosa HHB12029]|uniref:Uncharacterized protein n=1 Tax=Exidia glandulosa HHB12029 TaxID=1314781 RepID=A0A165DC68_EXIGL|nr:hypothetical protein EXIGLDRAFT_776788 [Exidia glandulosa HHB12029]